MIKVLATATGSDRKNRGENQKNCSFWADSTWRHVQNRTGTDKKKLIEPVPAENRSFVSITIFVYLHGSPYVISPEHREVLLLLHESRLMHFLKQTSPPSRHSNS